jgi:putative ABC transport system permease protein
MGKWASASTAESLLHDLRFSVRGLWKKPGVAIVAVLTLAMGIGANTAIFGVLSDVLLRPLPYPDADRLVRIASVNPGLGVSDSRSSGANVLDWQRQTTVFEELACFQEWDGILTAAGESDPVRVNWATPNLMGMLGVRPVVGRVFADGDAEPGLVLPQGIWQRRFGGDPAAIGQPVKEDDTNGVVVGVLPPAAAAPAQGVPPLDQVFVRMNLPRLTFPRDWQLFNVIGRLKPGVSVAQAQADLGAVAARLEREYPETNRGWGVKVTSLARWTTQPVRPQLLAVYVATVVILLVACLNVSNLLLMRGEGRRKELAVRCVLGCTRVRLLRQLLIESLVIAAAGGAAGVVLAAWCRRALLGLAPESLGLGTDWAIGPRALLSAAGVTLAAALLSGLSPALRLSGGNLNLALGETGRGSAGRTRHRLLSTLVVAQIAVSAVLLVAAALAAVSFQKITRIDPGFATRNTVSCLVATHDDGESIPRVIDALAAMPGVESTGAANIELLDDLHSLPIRITVDGAGEGGGEAGVSPATVNYWIVTPGYFSAAGIRMLAGRPFDSRDTAGDGFGAVIINDALAERCFPNRDPVGGIIRIPRPGRKDEPGVPHTIVGVAASVRQGGLPAAAVPILYVPNAKVGTGSVALMIRTRTDAAAVLPAIRSTIRGVDPSLAVTRVSTTGQIVAQSLAGRRFATLLMSVFATLGTLLAALGLHGVISYAVGERTREIGIRMAVGAGAGRVMRLIVGQGMRLVVLGIAIGLTVAFAVTRVMRSLLFDVSPTDPATYAAIAALLCAVALVGCVLPARRASRVDPLVALRQE